VVLDVLPLPIASRHLAVWNCSSLVPSGAISSKRQIRLKFQSTIPNTKKFIWRISSII
jgi:hypothetical protein